MTHSWLLSDSGSPKEVDGHLAIGDFSDSSLIVIVFCTLFQDGQFRAISYLIGNTMSPNMLNNNRFSIGYMNRYFTFRLKLTKLTLNQPHITILNRLHIHKFS